MATLRPLAESIAYRKYRPEMEDILACEGLKRDEVYSSTSISSAKQDVTLVIGCPFIHIDKLPNTTASTRSTHSMEGEVYLLRRGGTLPRGSDSAPCTSQHSNRA
jgi:hypothetical protein